MSLETSRARDVWRLLEPIHAVCYFSPEPSQHLKEAGYRGFWMGYFAGRAAPLGQTPAELVHALFYNFALTHVKRAVPDAWKFAPPTDALKARSEGSVAALRRQLGGLGDLGDLAVARAAELAARAAAEAPMEGRALFAANRALDEPTGDPVGLLWHSATLLREHRGDGHVAALTAAGVSGREAHVLHSLAVGIPMEVFSKARHFDAVEWKASLDALRRRGYVDREGALSDAGRRIKRRIEGTTDDLAWTAFRSLKSTEVDELLSALMPLTRAVVAAGELPLQSPMGLDLTEPLGTPPLSDG